MGAPAIRKAGRILKTPGSAVVPLLQRFLNLFLELRVHLCLAPKNAHLKVICIRQAGVEKLRKKDQMLTRRLEELCGWMQFFARNLIPFKLSLFPSLVSSPKRNLISSCHIDSYLYSFSGEGLYKKQGFLVLASICFKLFLIQPAR